MDLPPYLETRELGRMPLVTSGPDWCSYEHVCPKQGGMRYPLTFIVRPPRLHDVDAATMTADVDRLWRTLWTLLERISERAMPIVKKELLAVAESGEALPDPGLLLSSDRLYVVEYNAAEVKVPWSLTFDAYELECRKILCVSLNSNFEPVAVEFDG